MRTLRRLQTYRRLFKSRRNCESAVYAVLMKSIAPVSPAKRQAIASNQIAVPLLRRLPLNCENRMTVTELRDDFFRIDRALFVQCHTERMPRPDVLQDVHVVRKRSMI